MMRGLALALFAVGCTAAPADSSVEQEEAELAPYMDLMQRHGAKLGYAIQARNLKLSEFYLHEIEESLEEIAAEIPEHDGYPIARLIDQVALPGLAPLEEAMTIRSWSRIDEAYVAMIDTCNACHAATEHEFLVILPAEGEPPFMQRFAPSDN